MSRYLINLGKNFSITLLQSDRKTNTLKRSVRMTYTPERCVRNRKTNTPKRSVRKTYTPKQSVRNTNSEIFFYYSEVECYKN